MRLQATSVCVLKLLVSEALDVVVGVAAGDLRRHLRKLVGQVVGGRGRDAVALSIAGHICVYMCMDGWMHACMHV
jgi:hypothetical protein